MSDPSENSDNKNEPQPDKTENQSNLKLRINLNTYSSLTISRFSPLHKQSPKAGKNTNDQNASPITFKNRLQIKEKESSEQRNKIIKPESFHVIIHALKILNYPFRGLN